MVEIDHLRLAQLERIEVRAREFVESVTHVRFGSLELYLDETGVGSVPFTLLALELDQSAEAAALRARMAEIDG